MSYYATRTYEPETRSTRTTSRPSSSRARIKMTCSRNPLRDPKPRNGLSGYRYYNAELGRWPNRDPLEEKGGRNLYAFTVNNPVQYVDYIGLFGLIPIDEEDASPRMCGKISALMDVWAVGPNQTLWDHYKNGGGSQMDVPFGWFDPFGAIRISHTDTALFQGLQAAAGLECTGSGSFFYLKLGEQHHNYLVHMIFGWRLDVACDVQYSATWDSGCCECQTLSAEASCMFGASDKVNFWNGVGARFPLPPYDVADEFINACNLGQGFWVYANDEMEDSDTVDCESFNQYLGTL